MTITQKQINKRNAYTVSLVAVLVYLQRPHDARLRTILCYLKVAINQENSKKATHFLSPNQ